MGQENIPICQKTRVLAAYSTVSTSLAQRSDRRLGELVEAAVPLGSGIGGTSALLEVDGKPVFVKRVPLTDMERLPEHARSTANVFGIPTFCQYGVGGGPGFGAWRELAVHTMTTNWVLEGQCQGFPMMYHWRVLPDRCALPEELAEVERVVAYWGGSSEVRRRIEALQQSTASLALFLGRHRLRRVLRYCGERCNSDAGSQYTSVAFTERLAQAGIAPSIGSVTDAYDNALAESTIGLFKTELITRCGPSKTFTAVEFATAEWIDWYNHRRLHGALGHISPAEYETAYHHQHTRANEPVSA
ncbi:hypothetical protein GCM10027074_77760 [Streptomyces deserti]